MNTCCCSIKGPRRLLPVLVGSQFGLPAMGLGIVNRQNTLCESCCDSMPALMYEASGRQTPGRLDVLGGNAGVLTVPVIVSRHGNGMKIPAPAGSGRP